MAIAFDGTQVPNRLATQNCGGTPIFDSPAGYGYRCDVCNAVIGSIGQSKRCKEINSGLFQEGEEEVCIKLSEEGADVVIDAMENPPTINDKLLSAAKAYNSEIFKEKI